MLIRSFLSNSVIRLIRNLPKYTNTKRDVMELVKMRCPYCLVSYKLQVLSFKLSGNSLN